MYLEKWLDMTEQERVEELEASLKNLCFWKDRYASFRNHYDLEYLKYLIKYSNNLIKYHDFQETFCHEDYC